MPFTNFYDCNIRRREDCFLAYHRQKRIFLCLFSPLCLLPLNILAFINLLTMFLVKCLLFALQMILVRCWYWYPFGHCSTNGTKILPKIFFFRLHQRPAKYIITFTNVSKKNCCAKILHFWAYSRKKERFKSFLQGVLGFTRTNIQIKPEMIQWSGNEPWLREGHVPKMEQWSLMG